MHAHIELVACHGGFHVCQDSDPALLASLEGVDSSQHLGNHRGLGNALVKSGIYCIEVDSG